MHFSMPAGISHLSNEQFPSQPAEQNENILTLQSDEGISAVAHATGT